MTQESLRIAKKKTKQTTDKNSKTKYLDTRTEEQRNCFGNNYTVAEQLSRLAFKPVHARILPLREKLPFERKETPAKHLSPLPGIIRLLLMLCE